MLDENPLDLVQFMISESSRTRQCDGTQPVFRLSALLCRMNMGRFIEIRFVEPEPVSPDPQHNGHKVLLCELLQLPLAAHGLPIGDCNSLASSTRAPATARLRPGKGESEGSFPSPRSPSEGPC